MSELLVVKRDCSEQTFDESKIYNAIMKAMENGSGIIKPKIAESIAKEIHEECKGKESVDISDIELMVFDKLITKKQRLTARASSTILFPFSSLAYCCRLSLLHQVHVCFIFLTSIVLR